MFFLHISVCTTGVPSDIRRKYQMFKKKRVTLDYVQIHITLMLPGVEIGKSLGLAPSLAAGLIRGTISR